MKKKMILFAAGGLVLAAGGAGAFFTLRPKPAPPPEAAAAAKPEPPGIVEMEPFLVNINDPGGEHYAKLDLRLTVAPHTAAEHINADPLVQARMRDRVLTLITSKTLEDLIGPLGKEGLRREIKAHLEPLLEQGQIQDVLFSEFVVQ